MSRFKESYTKKLFKAVAQTHGISVAEVRAEIQAVIEDARNNPDPKKQAEFKKWFGNRSPTPEEFIYAVTQRLKH